MKMEINAQSLSHASLPKPPISSSAPASLPFFHLKASFLASTSVPFGSYKSFLAQVQGVTLKGRQQRNPGAIHASEAATPLTDVAERWLLVPVGDATMRGFKSMRDYGSAKEDLNSVTCYERIIVHVEAFLISIVAILKSIWIICLLRITSDMDHEKNHMLADVNLHTKIKRLLQISSHDLLLVSGDGDSSHIGFKVKMPDAFEIVSNEVTVGRVPDKADLVIPVATVSALHARLQKKEGSLLVTDLDSTNGTFIDDKRLRPGVAAILSSGSCITFGDIHLAMFRASKLGNVEAASKAEESEDKVENDNPPEVTETS